MVEWIQKLTPQQLLLVNGAVVTLLAVYFLSAKGKREKPSALKMAANSEGPGEKPVTVRDTKNQQSTQPQAAVSRAKPGPSERTKSLNVIFMYNQHTFDAHEILGVPAGSSLAVIKEAYDDLVKELPDEKRPLVEAAFQAICADH